jgi:hypothetical protein
VGLAAIRFVSVRCPYFGIGKRRMLSSSSMWTARPGRREQEDGRKSVWLTPTALLDFCRQQHHSPFLSIDHTDYTKKKPAGAGTWEEGWMPFIRPYLQEIHPGNQ